MEYLSNYQRGDGFVLQEIFFPCCSLGGNWSAGSWDTEINGSFQSDALSLLGCHCCVKSGD